MLLSLMLTGNIEAQIDMYGYADSVNYTLEVTIFENGTSSVIYTDTMSVFVWSDAQPNVSMNHNGQLIDLDGTTTDIAHITTNVGTITENTDSVKLEITIDPGFITSITDIKFYEFDSFTNDLITGLAIDSTTVAFEGESSLSTYGYIFIPKTKVDNNTTVFNYDLGFIGGKTIPNSGGIVWIDNIYTRLTFIDNRTDYLSIDKDIELAEFNLYPNPATNVININTITNSPIKIYNLMGEIVLTKNTTNGKTSINIEKLPSGVYLITDGKSFKKFIKE